MTNPKITLNAELDESSFEAELAKLKASVDELGDKLKTASGKSEFNLSGTQAELSKLISQAEKLTSALDKGDKKTSQYVKNLKAAQDALTQAAKVASKLEDFGGKGKDASNYFKIYASELAEESSVSRDNADRKSKEAEQRKRDAARDASNAKWANSAAKFAGFVGGTVTGGGGGYSTMLSGLGSMLPGPWGAIGGQVGGMLGGSVDRTLNPARQEAKTYSELRRELGGTVVDFERLRESVRRAVDGFGVADAEAANLAKSFARTAGLSGDETDEIARATGTSAGFAQGYGIGPELATAFMANMRLSGVASNDKDNRRLALLIGEAVQKGGTSAKMDEVLAALSHFAGKSALQTLTTPNVGSYASLMSTMTSSGYAGIKRDPNNTAQLMGIADAGVLTGGTMGEASQFHWLQSRMEAFKGMSALDNSTMQNAGLLGSLSDQFKPGSAVYDRAVATGDTKTREHMDQLRENILASGKDTNLAVGMAHIKNISHGDANVENANFRGMYGGTPQQAAALMQAFDNDKGLGNLEGELKNKYGITINQKDMKVSQVASMAQLIGGGDQAMAKQYQKLLNSGKLSANELDKGDKLMQSGYTDELKKYLLELTAKYDTDDGLESQKTQIEISNKISRTVAELIPIETDIRATLLKILDHFDSADGIYQRMAERVRQSVQENGKNMDGSDIQQTPEAIRARKAVDADLNAGIQEILQADTQAEKEAIARKIMAKANKNKDIYPAETQQIVDKALGKEPESKIVKPDDASAATIPEKVAPASGTKAASYAPSPNTQAASYAPASGGSAPKGVVDMVSKPSQYDKLFEEAGKKYGVDPVALKTIAARESGLDPNAVGHNATSEDYGIMQHNSRYMAERGINQDNWKDPRANIMAGAELFKKNLDKSGGDYQEAFRRYNGTGARAEKYAKESMAVWGAVRDVMDKNAVASAQNKPAETQPSAPDYKTIYTGEPKAGDYQKLAKANNADNKTDKPQQASNASSAGSRKPDYKKLFSKASKDNPMADSYLSLNLDDALAAKEMEKLPDKPKPEKTETAMAFKHSINVTLRDTKGNRLADPVLSTKIGSPKAAGVSA